MRKNVVYAPMGVFHALFTIPQARTNPAECARETQRSHKRQFRNVLPIDYHELAVPSSAKAEAVAVAGTDALFAASPYPDEVPAPNGFPLLD